jgi:protein-tyrosine-phosphatase
MKVLFICYANVGRSQVAEACFKMLSPHECESAGIAVNDRLAAMKLASRKLKDTPNQSSVQFIRRELGVDIGEKERRQLVPEMIDTADFVVVIAEKERWPPKFTREDERVVYDTITELNETHTLSGLAYDRALAALGLDLLIELIAAAGFYTMVAMTLNAFDAPVPGGKRPLS